METYAVIRITALNRLALSHEDLSGCSTHSPEEALAIYAKSWRLERRYYELWPWVVNVLLELNGYMIACLPDHQWFWPRLMGISGVEPAWRYAEQGGIEFQGFSRQSCTASFYWTYIAFSSGYVVINIWFSIEWNTSVVNELLGHIPATCSEFSKTDDSLSSDSAAKSFSKFRCKEKKKKFMKILT